MTVTSLFVYYFGICLLFKVGMQSTHISDIDISYKRLRLKAIVSQWLHRCTKGVLCGKRDGAGSNLGIFFFFVFFFVCV